MNITIVIDRDVAMTIAAAVGLLALSALWLRYVPRRIAHAPDAH